MRSFEAWVFSFSSLRNSIVWLSSTQTTRLNELLHVVTCLPDSEEVNGFDRATPIMVPRLSNINPNNVISTFTRL